MKLPLDFYLQKDVVSLSKQLLGKYLLTNFDGLLTGGPIIETEAYQGPEDRASHAYNFRRTARNEVMYAQGGVGYIYLCYGVHHLFNVVTNAKELPHAVLIRAIEPQIGIETMKERRKTISLKQLTSGPAKLAQALGLNLSYNGISLLKNEVWIEDRGQKPKAIKALCRIGIDYAGKDAKLPWRFVG